MPRDPKANPNDDRNRIEHMLVAARDALTIASQHRAHEIAQDMILRRALVNALEVLGEAASKVSEHGRARMPAMEWRGAIALRNRLIHGYDTIDYDTAWTISTTLVPTLIRDLEAGLTNWPES